MADRMFVIQDNSTKDGDDIFEIFIVNADDAAQAKALYAAHFSLNVPYMQQHVTAEEIFLKNMISEQILYVTTAVSVR